MNYVSVNVEIDFDDFMEDADDYVVEQFVKEYLQASDPDWIQSIIGGRVVSELDAIPTLLQDPVKRLEVITVLRAEGYTVEPS